MSIPSHLRHRRTRAGIAALFIASALAVAACGNGGGNAAGSSSGSSGQVNLIAQIQHSGQLRICAAESTPNVIQSATNDSQWSGVFVDLMRDWATNVLKVKPVIVPASWQTIIASLQAGQCDVALALDATPSRTVAVQFSTGVRRDIGALVLYPGKTGVKSWNDLNAANHTICVATGTSFETALEATSIKAQLLKLPQTTACLSAIASGRATAAFVAWTTAASYAATNAGASLVFTPSPFVNFPNSIAVPLNTSPSSLAALNAEITAWDNSPSGLQASLARYDAGINPLKYALPPVPAWAQTAANTEFVSG